MTEQKRNDQDERVGGYGGSTGGARPEEAGEEGSASAAGRDEPGRDAVDADEALGNRSGGYGNASEEENEGS